MPEIIREEETLAMKLRVRFSSGQSGCWLRVCTSSYILVRSGRCAGKA